MRMTTLKRMVEDINIFLNAIFKKASFAITTVTENTYEFTLMIDDVTISGSIFREDFNAHSTQYMFDWIDKAVKEAWKHRNMEWS